MSRKKCLKCAFLSKVFVHDQRELPYMLNDDEREAITQNDFSFLRENNVESFFNQENNSFLHCPNDGFEDVGLESFTKLEKIKTHGCPFWANYDRYKDQNLSCAQILDVELVRNTRNSWVMWIIFICAFFSAPFFFYHG